jgi:hypothetical protein
MSPLTTGKADSEKFRQLFFMTPLHTHDFKILQNENCSAKNRNDYVIF